MKKYDVSFEFLEKRMYVQVTTLTYKVLELLKDNGFITSQSEIVKLDATFKEKVVKNGYYVFDDNSVADIAKSFFKIKLADRVIKAYFVEEDREISQRIPYNEDILSGEAVVDISNLKAKNQLSDKVDNLFNIIIATIKRVHLEGFTADGFGSWSTGKFSLSWGKMFEIAPNGVLRVGVASNIDDCYTKNDIYIDDEFIGILYAGRKRG